MRDKRKMNSENTKMEVRHVAIALAIAILCFCIGMVTAIPQQDYTLHGTATFDDTVLTAQDDAVISLAVDGLELVSYKMGDIPGTNNYVLKVPMDSDTSVTTAAQEGDTAYIFINGVTINEGPQIIGAPGATAQIDISASVEPIQPKTAVNELWRYKTNRGVDDVAIADIDNDGELEVLVASDQLYVLNKSGGKKLAVGQNIVSVETGDLVENGIKDIITAEYGGNICAYTGIGLELWNLTLTTDYPKVITAFDLNNDGTDEVLVASRECKFYLISGDGSIWWSYPIGVWSDTNSMAGAVIADINNDNVLDIVVGGRASKITALCGANGIVIWDFMVPGWVGGILNAGDLNGDGYDDVVVGSWDTDVYAISGTTGKLLWEFVTPGHGHAPASVGILGDINSDGTQDIAVGLDDVYALDGTTGHQIWTSTDSFRGIDKLVTTDLNADGNLDLCIGTNGCDPYANVYALDGHNGSTLWSFLDPKYTVCGLTAGDINKNGKNDIIAGSQDSYVYALTTLSDDRK
ncbi:Outer membrane protein assembly factor BamB, contains PQQ-like beta-propeller repeat [Methanophagales archaeon]|nr:Outer membrane protein assembly factor BamB, contains PQQ-like beta-propeller repeat [Methanophagales archaeon]